MTAYFRPAARKYPAMAPVVKIMWSRFGGNSMQFTPAHRAYLLHILHHWWHYCSVTSWERHQQPHPPRRVASHQTKMAITRCSAVNEEWMSKARATLDRKWSVEHDAVESMRLVCFSSDGFNLGTAVDFVSSVDFSAFCIVNYLRLSFY